MNEHVTRLLEAPVYARLGALAGMVAVVGGIYYTTVFSDMGTEIASVNGEIEKLTVELSQKTAIANSLPRFEREVERLDVELKRALAELPDKTEIPQLLERISDKARDAGLTVSVFKPQAGEMKDFYAEIPIQIEVSGGYHQVATFFDEVGHLERIVNVDQIGFSEPKKTEDGMLLKTTILATSFRFLDESERPKEDNKKKARKRRKGSEESAKSEE